MNQSKISSQIYGSNNNTPSLIIGWYLLVFSTGTFRVQILPSQLLNYKKKKEKHFYIFNQGITLYNDEDHNFRCSDSDHDSYPIFTSWWIHACHLLCHVMSRVCESTYVQDPIDEWWRCREVYNSYTKF